MKKIKLLDKWVGNGNPSYIVAEIGTSFKNFKEAKRLIDSAVEINVDAIKFQTFEAETLTTKTNYFDMEATGKVSQYELFKDIELPKDLQLQIVKYANEQGITIFSAPSHMKDIDFMEKMDLPFYKIGSDLACHIPLLKKIAKLGKPIILSTGMCKMEEIRESVNAILSTKNEQIILLHCVSDYPSKVEETNLNAMLAMKKEFDFPVGFSDHSVGILTSLAAVALGANMIERHLRDESNSTNPDDAHALTKDEFKKMIISFRQIEISKGTGEKLPSESEKNNLLSNRVSIISMSDIPVGSIITKEMIDIRRPGTGIPPKYYEDIIGKKTVRDVKKEHPISLDDIE